MTEKQQQIFTFHRVREECEQGSADAWRAFLELYTPQALSFFALYAPAGSGDPKRLWANVVAALSAHNFERLRATARQSEREFLADVRALLLDTITETGTQASNAVAPNAAAESEPETTAEGTQGATPGAVANATQAHAAAEGTGASLRDESVAPVTPSAAVDTGAGTGAGTGSGTGAGTGFAAKLPKLLEGLPLLHQEMIFFRLAGYTDRTIELMLRVAPRVAQGAFERLSADFAAAQNLEHDRCPWPAEWLALLHGARAAKTDKCPPLHQFMRVHDGQVSWYEKEPVERHVAGCLHCLEAWTALREVGYWRRAAPPLPSAEIEELLRGVPVEVTPKKSIFRRVFS